MRLASFSALAMVSGLVLGCSKPFSGDGVMIDKGFWSYPRYVITFDAFDPRTQPRITLKCNGPPRASMTLGLVVVPQGRNEDAEAMLRSTKWGRAILSVKVMKEDGKLVAEARGPFEKWVIAISSQHRELWHENLRDVPFKPGLAYRIIIEVSGVDTGDPPLVLRPVLEGGGSERPW